MKKDIQVYSGIGRIPRGQASEEITEGCLILEGGAWRGIYTQGVLDALMLAGINFKTTIGVSAGAMSGIGYVSGQIGWAPRINLTYRQDPNYCGFGAMRRDHGITGFSYFFDDILQDEPVDLIRFYDPDKEFYAVATNVLTGEARYFSRDGGLIRQGIQASATVPYASKPVVINGVPYLDGGCAVNIPYAWALKRHEKKIVIIKTRDRKYRSVPKRLRPIDRLLYGRYPKFLNSWLKASRDYNVILDKIDRDEKAGKIFVFAPEEPINMRRFESDMEVLGALYERGLREGKKRIPQLRAWLES